MGSGKLFTFIGPLADRAMAITMNKNQYVSVAMPYDAGVLDIVVKCDELFPRGFWRINSVWNTSTKFKSEWKEL